MAQGQIIVHGLAEFRAAARAAIGKAPRALTGALRKAGQPILRRARSDVPHQTGLLSSSLKVSVRSTTGSIVSAAPYAGGAEWGRHGKWAGWVSKHGGPPRFVWPAVESEQDEVIDILDAELKEVITILGWAK